VACVLAAIGLMGALGAATALCGVAVGLTVLRAPPEPGTGEAAAAVKPAP
jgi:hypothetical protein